MIYKVFFGILLNIFIISFAISQYSDNNEKTSDTTESKLNDPINNMLLQSISLIGIPYKWGGNTPQQGMDCSGFIRYVFKKSLGINLPRTSAEIAKNGISVKFSNIKPGDLIFFNTKRGHNTHIGMYIGNNKFIQSPHTGEDIQISDLNPKIIAKISAIKRIVDANLDSTQSDDDSNDVDNDGSDDNDEDQNITNQRITIKSPIKRKKIIPTKILNNSKHIHKHKKKHYTRRKKKHHQVNESYE